MSTLLPATRSVASQQSLASITAEARRPRASLLAAAGDGRVALGPGTPRLVVFFATWLSEISDLKSELTGAERLRQAAASSRTCRS